MAIKFKLSEQAQNIAVDSVCSMLDGGSLCIYEGIQPSNADAQLEKQNLLARFNLDTPAFGKSVEGVAVANGVLSTNVQATGTAMWFRCFNSSGEPVFDGSVGLSGCNINLSSVALQLYGVLILTSFTYMLESK